MMKINTRKNNNTPERLLELIPKPGTPAFECIDTNNANYKGRYNEAVKKLANLKGELSMSSTDLSDTLLVYACATADVWKYDVKEMGQDYDESYPISKPRILSHAKAIYREYKKTQKACDKSTDLVEFGRTAKFLFKLFDFLSCSIRNLYYNRFLLYACQPSLACFRANIMKLISRVVEETMLDEYLNAYEAHVSGNGQTDNSLQDIVRAVGHIVSALFRIPEMRRLTFSEKLKRLLELSQSTVAVNISKGAVLNQNAYPYKTFKEIKTGLENKYPFVRLTAAMDIGFSYENASELLDAISTETYDSIRPIIGNEAYQSLFTGYTDMITTPEEYKSNPDYAALRDSIAGSFAHKIISVQPENLMQEILTMHENKQIHPTLFAFICVSRAAGKKPLYEISETEWKKIDLLKFPDISLLKTNDNAIPVMLDYDRIHGFPDSKLPILKYFLLYENEIDAKWSKKPELMNRIPMAYVIQPLDTGFDKELMRREFENAEEPFFTGHTYREYLEHIKLYDILVNEQLWPVLDITLEAVCNPQQDVFLLQCMRAYLHSLVARLLDILRENVHLPVNTTLIIYDIYNRLGEVKEALSNPNSKYSRILTTNMKYLADAVQSLPVLINDDMCHALSNTLPLETEEDVARAEEISDMLDYTVVALRPESRDPKCKHLMTVLNSKHRLK